MASTTASTSHIISNLHLGADADGVDLKVFGDTSGAYLMWDASANNLLFTGAAGIAFGTLSSDSQTGITLSASNPSVFDVFADDGNATLGNENYFVIRGRAMLFKDATGISLFGVRGQVKAANGVDFGPGVYAGVQGYMELVGDTSVQSGGKWWGVDSSFDVPSSKTLTVASGGIAGGFHAELTGSGTATQSSGGILAGLYVDEQITSGKWGYGVYIVGTAATVPITVGTKANTAGSGTVLAQTDDFGAVRIFTDDNGASVGQSVRGLQSRTLLTYDQAGGSIRAAQGQLKLNTNIDVGTGIYTAVQGYVEMAGTHSANSGATLSCFDASAEITTALTVASGGEFYGVHIETTGAGTITNNGTCAAIGITTASGAADWPVGLYMIGTSVTTAASIGTKANTAGSGVVLAQTDDAGVFRIFADDNGASVGQSVRNLQARTLLTVDQTGGSIRSIQGQLKLNNGVDVTSGIYTALQGYLEMAATHSAKTGSTFSCIDASAEIGTALTVDSGGEFFGIHVETTGAGTITNNGTAAAIGVTTASGAADWPIGLYMVGTSVAKAIQVGTLSSTSQTGLTLSSTNTSAVDVFTDDGNATLGSAVYHGIRSRTMLFKDASGCTIVGVKGQLKAADGVDFATGVYAGVQGYMELYGDTAIQSGGKFWGVDSSIDVPSSKTLTIDSGGICAGLHAELTGSGTASSSGTLAGLYIDEQIATGDWDYGIYVASGKRCWYSTNTLSGSSALNNMHIVTTDATTPSSASYSRSIYVAHTNTGTKSGNAEVNAIAADVDASANVTSMYPFTAYIGACNGATINRVAGYAIYIDALTGTVGASSCAHLETNGGATTNDFISVRRHGGTISAIISDRSGGSTATHVLAFAGANAPVGSGDKTGGSKTYALSVDVGGATKWIQLYDG